MRYFLIVVLLAGCGFNLEPTVWGSKPKRTSLTSKAISNLPAREEGESFKVALIADPQAVYGGLKKAIERINQRTDIDFIFVLGDITDRAFIQEFDLFGDIINNANVPVLTVVGNHDGLGKGDKIYRKMFGPLNYTFTHAGVKFIAWNNNYYEWGTPDIEWLDNESDSEYVVHLAHQPPRSGTLSKDFEQDWEFVRDNTDVKASLHGHVHSWHYDIENGNTSVFITDRVDHGYYSVMEWNNGVPSFYQCSKTCQLMKGD